MKLLVLIVFISGLALAGDHDLAHRPQSFPMELGKAIFVDFERAHYIITYDINQKSAWVRADIDFTTPESGFPIFDSVQNPSRIKLDGQETSHRLISTPGNESQVRVLAKEVKEGTHHMSIEIPLKTLVEFVSGGVKSAFWTSDLSNRRYLESYLPANFEFDQVEMIFSLKFIGGATKQTIYTNGQVQILGEGEFRIFYPSTYTSSSIFFHTVPEGTFAEIMFDIKSRDGRDLPTTIYVAKSFGDQRTLEDFKKETVAIIQELEADYGPFPHQSITIYNAGRGGMEYCGATITEKRALGHELFHSYFARGVMPANGNSGWIDEALASWRDKGYLSQKELEGTSQMSAQPYYTRTTDQNAYDFGERFMRYMNQKLQGQGGLKPFMRHMIEHRAFSPLFVEEFMAQMSGFYQISLEEDFKKYTFGKSTPFHMKNDFHPKMDLEELRKHL